LLSLLEKLSPNVWINACQIAKQLLRHRVILEEIEAHPLTTLDCQALDVVEDEAREVGVRRGELCLALLTLKL